MQPVSCVVEEEINGDYRLTITMKKWDTQIQNEAIISAPTPKNGYQLFRAYATDVDAFGNNIYYARHIFYDLRDNFLEDVRPSGNGQEALNRLLSGTQYTGESDITVSSTSYYQMMGIVEAIMGGDNNNDNAFVNRWGGELERDNFHVRINQHMGEDRNVTIRYRKNLTGLTVDTCLIDVATRIYPTGRAADGQTLLRLPEKYVDSPLVDSYVRPKSKRIDYSDIQVGKDDMTEEQAYNALRAAAQNEFAKGIDKPNVSAKVQFIPLEATEEYKNLAVLEKIYIGDTVHVIHEPLGIELNMEISKYQYNCLTERYNSIELGTPQAMIGGSDSLISQDIQTAAKSAESAMGYAGLAQMFNNLMCNALGTYSTIQKNLDGSAIYYMHDKPKLVDSGTIYKLSASGFAVSKDGGKTFPYGFSADANIVANVIAATMIQSATNPNVYFDLVNGIIASSRLVASDDSGIYADVGTEEPQYGNAHGLFLYHGTGADTKFVQIYHIPDSRHDGAQLLSLGPLSFMSNAGMGGKHANSTWFDKDSNDNGTFSLKLATSTGDWEPFSADTGSTCVRGKTKVSFSADGQERGSIDAGGYHGWIDEFAGYTGDIQIDNLTIHLTHGRISGVDE